METKSIPRIMISGTSSGCGKTTVTCALLQLLKCDNLKVSSFKCGPDYIDPMFHSKIIGINSSNLDMYFCNDNTIKYLFAKNSTDISVIEGVMGFYDGRALNTTEASSYELAKLLKTPVILTVNCRGMANSTLAVIKGFTELYPDNTIAGVILNNITKPTFEAIKIVIEKTFFGRIKVFGYLPKLPDDIIFESRHLGLITADEIANLQEKLMKLKQIAAETIDIAAIIETANNTDSIEYYDIKLPQYEKIKIAVAYDTAFCFYYRDNFEMLMNMGAELIYFSPLNDKNLPDNINGIYIGGGYPELYAEKLSANKSMLVSIKTQLKNNIPCIAECGGFMYLNKSIDGREMVGFFNGECNNTGKLTRFGYVELTANVDNLLCVEGKSIRGHEFHYYDCTDNGDSYIAEKSNGKTWTCIHSDEYIFAGFPHIHFYSNPNFAENFYKKCIERKRNNE